MRAVLVLSGLSLFCAAAAAQADDYRALNDCMAGDVETSIQACTRLIERGGHSTRHTADLYTLRGYAHASAEDRDKAMTDFGKAIELAPQSFGTHFLRGLVYQSMGERDRSRADHERAQALMKDQRPQPEAAIQYYCFSLALQLYAPQWGAPISGSTPATARPI
jgi:Flp pilus assembly protein TadD